jgi:hypothetical protein
MKIDPPDLPRQKTMSVADHEILLSFSSDEDASLFEEWWHRHGAKAFLAWAEKQVSEAAR